jgi:nicotinamidase-related amidase
VVSVAAAVQNAAIGSGIPVVQTRLAFDSTYFTRTNRTARFGRYPAEQLLKDSDAQAQIVPGLRRSDVVVVTKGCVDALVGTPLPAMLAANRITDLYIGGIATTLAVESAARHAADLGLRVWIIEDMCASFSGELHDLAVQKTLPLFAEIISSKDAIDVFERRRHKLTGVRNYSPDGYEVPDNSEPKPMARPDYATPSNR